jgi:hypothetical protein
LFLLLSLSESKVKTKALSHGILLDVSRIRFNLEAISKNQAALPFTLI